MGTQFSYYQTDDKFGISPVDELYAFVIYNSNLQISDLTMTPGVNSDWQVTENDNGDSTYNLLFRFKPGFGADAGAAAATSDFNDFEMFTVGGGTELDQNLYVHWVNDVTNHGTVGGVISDTPVFNDPYNQEQTTTDSGTFPCFFPDTLIKTPYGDTMIRDISKGMKIFTGDGRIVNVYGQSHHETCPSTR